MYHILEGITEVGTTPKDLKDVYLVVSIVISLYFISLAPQTPDRS